MYVYCNLLRKNFANLGKIFSLIILELMSNCINLQNFSLVYLTPFCSITSGTEHQRIVNLLKEGDVVYDMFAGVGPFAVPAAKKKCTVYANDLNPESYKWLGHNMKLNKVKGEFHLFNMDGREFVKSVVKKSLLELWKASCEGMLGRNIHVIMNLPAIAVEFLDVYQDLVSAEDLEAGGIDKQSVTMPTIHCYCFSKSENVTEDARLRIEDVLGQKLPDDHTIRIVRNVAPNKEMLCVTFVMPEGILFASHTTNHSGKY